MKKLLLMAAVAFAFAACGNSNSNKEKVINHFNIGPCNSKTLLKRLNSLNVSKEELEKIIND